MLTRTNFERETGIEPATSSLGSWHSTAELLPQKICINIIFYMKTINSTTLFKAALDANIVDIQIHASYFLLVSQ
jgi:hypothetical protein